MTLVETYRSEINTMPIEVGQLIICLDTQELFYDTSSTIRISIGSNIAYLNTEADKDKILVPMVNMLYIIMDSKIAYVYNDDGWVAVCRSDEISWIMDTLRMILLRLNNIDKMTTSIVPIPEQGGNIPLKNNTNYSMSIFSSTLFILPCVGDNNTMGKITLYLIANNVYPGMIMLPCEIDNPITESGIYKLEFELIPIVNIWICTSTKIRRP